VGELDNPASTQGWMDIVRPVLKMKMRKYGGTADGGNIRFNLLALVDDHYQAASDELELLKREKKALERRLDEAYPDGWSNMVRHFQNVSDANLHDSVGRSHTLSCGFGVFRDHCTAGYSWPTIFARPRLAQDGERCCYFGNARAESD
jgi:hypothetical protein